MAALTTVYTEEAARATLAGRYLDGRDVVFSVLARDWDELRERLEGLAGNAQHVPAMRALGVPALTLGTVRAESSDNAPPRAAELMEMAKVGAFDILGERDRAARIAERLLRCGDPSRVDVSQSPAAGSLDETAGPRRQG